MNLAAITLMFAPLVSGMINGLFAQKIDKNIAGKTAVFFMLLSSVMAAVIFYGVGINEQTIHIILFKWFDIGNATVNWSIYVDQLTAIMFIAVCFVSSVVHIYSLGYMADDENLPKFLCYLSLFTFFMLCLVSADNFMQLFFGWEGVGLCSYLLIGYWYREQSACKAAIKAFIVNRISDCAFVIGIIMLIIYTGYADFTHIFKLAPELTSLKISLWSYEIAILDIICLLLFIGCMGKSAQIGLHVWLPDAMEGPTPVSALIHAATMVTAGVFLLARCSYLFEYSPCVLQVIAFIGGVTCLFAASIAIAQSDIKKIIAYSTCSQLGYMFLACGMSCYKAGIFHLVTHAYFKALLFLSAGSIIHAAHEQDIFKLGGLKDKLPITYLNFWIGSLALIGIFPLAGFYSKDLILESAYNSHSNIGHIMFWVGILAASLTAIYSMKIILLTFHSESKMSKQQLAEVHESPQIMNAPLILLSAGALFSGMIGYYILRIDKLNGFFGSSIFNLEIHYAHLQNVFIEFLPLLIGIIGIITGYLLYKNKLYIKVGDRFKVISKILQNKYYFDEIYNLVFVKNTNCLSKLANIIDYKIIDKYGPGAFTNIINSLARRICALQTGYLFNYALIMISAIAVIITVFVINFIRVT